MYRRLFLLLFLAMAPTMASVTQLPRFLTVPEAAKASGVSPWSIRKEIADGRLKARRVGRLVRVTNEELARWMRDPADEAS